MKYIIVTGYYGNKEALFDIWWKNTLYHTRYNPPKDIYVINSGGTISNKRGKWVDIDYNIGHVCDTMKGGFNEHKHGLCGWTMSTLHAALLAYSCDCDLIYKEQDCLAFGNWVEKIYETTPEGCKIVTGIMDIPFKIEQSLFLIKKEFLIEFVREYLSLIVPDWEMVPEHKWDKLFVEKFSGRCGFLPFGYGRKRPVNYDDKIFYVQHGPVQREIQQHEWDELTKRKLI